MYSSERGNVLYANPSVCANLQPQPRAPAVDVQDLFEDSRRAPVSRLAPGYTVYRRPRMAEEGVPANAFVAELV
eukprot:COSAG02_NODE_3181_length_7215_cov_30.624930_1_plen_74_part_00